jgi:hypothetical protein
MTTEQLQAKLPLILGWIEETLAFHAPKARKVASIGFPRLSGYFSRELLASAKVVPVEVVPTPPLTAMGLPEFADFENMTANGITYLDTFFVRDDLADNERLHFHELIHVIQWRLLGAERFLMTYADGLTQYGYRHSPLERMAFMAETYYESTDRPFSMEEFVRMEFAESLPGIVAC